MSSDYGQHDVSSGTDSRNYFSRSVNPIGSLAHTTNGTNSLSWLQSGSAVSGRPASADYLIARNGIRYKLIPDGYAAYHAGVSTANLQGRQFTGDQISALLIGVEMEQQGEQVCTYEQIDSYAELLTKLSVVFGWRWPYTLMGHYEVARPVGRRSDPQGFAWGDFMGRLYLRSRDAQIAGL